MDLKYCLSLLVLSLILAACAGGIPTTPVAVNGTLSVLPADPGSVVGITPTDIPYPGPVLGGSPTDSAYPGPATPWTVTSVIPVSGYEPQPGDKNLKRGQVFLDLANSNFTFSGTPTSQVEVVLQGNLPDPCHSLRVVVTPPDANNVINLEAYSVVDPGVACTTVLKPFTASIPLGSYPDADYTVMVNGERLGLFSYGSGSAPAVQVTP